MPARRTLHVCIEEREALEDLRDHAPKPYLRERAAALLLIASVPDGEAIDALGFPAIQPEIDGFRMARTQQEFARHDGRRYAGRDEQ